MPRLDRVAQLVPTLLVAKIPPVGRDFMHEAVYYLSVDSDVYSGAA